MKYTKNGIVTKGVGGLYGVKTDDGEYLLVRAKGALKSDGDKVYIGDCVTVSGDDSVPDDIIISEIAHRQNSLIRPPIANISYLFVSFSVKKPEPVFETVDKLLAIAVHNNITPVVVLTKCDMAPAIAASYADVYQKAGFSVFQTSSLTPEDAGVRRLRDFVATELKNGKIAAFAGASGVGKSTLLNAVFPSLSLATGAVSARIERGKHTTRAVELYPTSKEGNTGYLADTPGFSLLDFEHFDFFALDDLEAAFPDILRYRGKCRYADCAHVGEGPAECAVAAACEKGEIGASRLASYRTLYRTLKNKTNY